VRYVIAVRGLVDDTWGAQFADLDFALERNELEGLTLLISARDTDQAQLHAALKQVRDMGLELLGVEHHDPATDEPDE
jgi:hypothetical protein